MKGRSHEISVHLDDLSHLFTALIFLRCNRVLEYGRVSRPEVALVFERHGSGHSGVHCCEITKKYVPFQHAAISMAHMCAMLAMTTKEKNTRSLVSFEASLLSFKQLAPMNRARQTSANT